VQVAVSGFASKRLGVFLSEDTLIFRSDSNGEDLEVSCAPIAETVRYHPSAAISTYLALPILPSHLDLSGPPSSIPHCNLHP
jgi:hypothetical protein